jgi:hypothetical protein
MMLLLRRTLILFSMPHQGVTTKEILTFQKKNCHSSSDKCSVKEAEKSAGTEVEFLVSSSTYFLF